MANQLIPPTGLAPPSPENLSPDQRSLLWADLVDASEEILLAGLSHQVGPDGDLRAAYRRWYEQEMKEHDHSLRQIAESLYRRGVRHGR